MKKRTKNKSHLTRSTLKVLGLAGALMLTSFAVLAQPAGDSATAPQAVTVTSDNEAPNWGLIATVVGAVGALITAIYQGRNSSMSLQVSSFAAQQERLDKGQQLLQEQLVERMNGYKQDLEAQKRIEQELRDRLDGLDTKLDNLTRENIRLEGKNSRLESENATLKLLLEQAQSKQIQAKVDINPLQG